VGIAPDIVAGVARRLAEHAGLELPSWVVEARAAARIAALDIAPHEYVALIGSMRGATELDELIESVRVGESRLFRHRSQITTLVQAVVPALRARGRRAIRVWSAGCAAGEEPYTLAAVLARALPGIGVAIIATDVSADALAAAARATYPASAWNDIPDEWRDGFELAGEVVRVRPEIAALVRFERANLADNFGPAPPRGCDVVWCRNVLIYFTPTARKRVVDRLIAATNPGGYVFVGYSESLRDIPELEAVRNGDAVYYVRHGDRASGPRLTPAMGVPSRTLTPATGVLVVRTPAAGVPVLKESSDWTPAPVMIPQVPMEDVLVLRGHPSARVVTAELMARLAIVGLQRLVIDLDSAELLGDELAPVLRRARAASRAAHVELIVRATRTGARRWLTRHELDGDEP
jgi:chemotaxis protein methyltransferase CheR